MKAAVPPIVNNFLGAIRNNIKLTQYGHVESNKRVEDKDRALKSPVEHSMDDLDLNSLKSYDIDNTVTIHILL